MKLHPFLAIYFLFYTLNFQNGSEAVNTKKQSRTPPNKNKNKKQPTYIESEKTRILIICLEKT
jgi:hypothetical protein